MTFIFGVPRSGTTLLWGILESHPDTIPFTAGEKKFNLWTTSESGVYIKTPKTAKEKITDFQKAFPNKLVFEKTPAHVLKHKEILKDFPESKNIVLWRHPMNILRSMMFSEMKAFQDYDFDKSIKEIKTYYRQLKKIEGLHISYVELTEFPLITVDKIYNYLGLRSGYVGVAVEKNIFKKIVTVQGALRENNKDLPFKQQIEAIKKLIHEIKIYHECIDHKPKKEIKL